MEICILVFKYRKGKHVGGHFSREDETYKRKTIGHVMINQPIQLGQIVAFIRLATVLRQLDLDLIRFSRVQMTPDQVPNFPITLMKDPSTSLTGFIYTKLIELWNQILKQLASRYTAKSTIRSSQPTIKIKDMHLNEWVKITTSDHYFTRFLKSREAGILVVFTSHRLFSESETLRAFAQADLISPK
ncbi:hypothetical protein AVEN_6612-1 [Araneus ventricosus]|uniref:Uncharacterized protein n=1 Tax=Araneus ventricosus TaxID=182803 RepID=A0A4Y2KZX6_ARAVE|nr:hypothetical protein AVEN_6612-1 [Araneus ventricosus]